jgi:hypothetical protein
MMGMRKYLPPRIPVVCLLLLTFTVGLDPTLAAEGMIMVSGTSMGTKIESSVAATMDLGAVGTVSLIAGLELATQDLLEAEQALITFDGGFRFDLPEGGSLSFGDVAGVPALRLLIEPHLFPSGDSVGLLAKIPKVNKIPISHAENGPFTVGLTATIPLGALGTISPFLFTPLVDSENLRGGGVALILPTSGGILSLGACYAGRSLLAEPLDELFYGGYPSEQGSYLQFSFTTLPWTFHLPCIGDGEWESRFQLFGMHDARLGHGVSHSSRLQVEIGTLSVVWEYQRLPIALGTPGLALVKADTSPMKEDRLSLTSSFGDFEISWIFTDKVWRPSPYASDYQKRTVSTLAVLDFFLAGILVGCDIRSEVAWLVTGARSRTGSVGLRFDRQWDEVRIVLKPTCTFSLDAVVEIKLDCAIVKNPDEGIAWDATFGFKAETVWIVLAARYGWEDKLIKVSCDSSRKISLSLAIGR